MISLQRRVPGPSQLSCDGDGERKHVAELDQLDCFFRRGVGGMPVWRSLGLLLGGSICTMFCCPRQTGPWRCRCRWPGCRGRDEMSTLDGVASSMKFSLSCSISLRQSAAFEAVRKSGLGTHGDRRGQAAFWRRGLAHPLRDIRSRLFVTATWHQLLMRTRFRVSMLDAQCDHDPRKCLGRGLGGRLARDHRLPMPPARTTKVRSNPAWNCRRTM